jgi:origin recognition complex subunit 2
MSIQILHHFVRHVLTLRILFQATLLLSSLKRRDNQNSTFSVVFIFLFFPFAPSSQFYSFQTAMSELIVRDLDDDEAVQYFINTVNPTAAKREADVTKTKRMHTHRRLGRGKRRYQNAGLTVASTEEVTDEVPNLLKQHDDAEQILLHAPNRHNRDRRNNEHSEELGEPGSGSDKENGAVGRDMFGLSKMKGKGVESMMKRAMVATVPIVSKRGRGRPKKLSFASKVSERLAETSESQPAKDTLESPPPVKISRRGRKSKATLLAESMAASKRQRDIEVAESHKVANQATRKKRAIDSKIELLNEKEANDSDEHESDSDQQEEKESDDEQEVPLDNRERDGYDRYFQDLRSTNKTSNNTLSQLPILDPGEFKEKLSQAPKKHAKDIAILHSLHERQFPQWQFELLSHYNLLFYGYGSKRKLLTKFAQTFLTDGPLIVVNGYFPSITIKDILTKLSVGALGINAPTGSIQDHVSLIMEHFQRGENEYEHIYLLIHNIDGANIRNERAQTALSILASCPNIHIIASIDHINAGLLWDSIKIARFNWIWHDATTFDDYMVETSFENTLMVRQSELGGSRGVNYVLASLTSNARGIFRVLAEHQIMEMELANMEGRGDESVGLTYNGYYTKCREAFFVSNDITFRTQLTEFRDHKVIQSKRSMDGTEVMYLPLDKSTLTNILETLS